MPRAVFDKLNEEREASGEPPFANPRNATAGSLKMQNSAQAAKRQLDCWLYFMFAAQLPTNSHLQNMECCRRWGFKVPTFVAECSSIDDILAFINHWDTERHNLPFDIDGIVIKVDSISDQLELGNTANATMGHCLQVQGGTSADKTSVGFVPSGAHRCRHASGQFGASATGRNNRQARNAA